MRHPSLALIDLYQTAEVPQYEPENTPETVAETRPLSPASQTHSTQDANYESNRAMVGSFILIMFGVMIGWLSHFMI